MYGVWVQPIDGNTGPDNLELYGEIDRYEDLYADGRVKEFCDGQTSPSPPRWANDRMMMLWVQNRETAEYLQTLLRNRLRQEVASGLALSSSPAWLSGKAALAISPAALSQAILAIRAQLELAERVTDSQIESAIKRYVQETGGDLSGAAGWIRKNRTWAVS